MSKRIMFWFNIQSFLFGFTSLWGFTWMVSDCEELVVPSDGSSRQKLD